MVTILRWKPFLDLWKLIWNNLREYHLLNKCSRLLLGTLINCTQSPLKICNDWQCGFIECHHFSCHNSHRKVLPQIFLVQPEVELHHNLPWMYTVRLHVNVPWLCRTAEKQHWSPLALQVGNLFHSWDSNHADRASVAGKAGWLWDYPEADLPFFFPHCKEENLILILSAFTSTFYHKPKMGCSTSIVGL